MLLQFPHPAVLTKYRRLSAMFPSLAAALIILASISPARLAAAAECQATYLSDGGPIQGVTAWKDTTLTIPPLAITAQRDIYGDTFSSPLLELAAPIQGQRFFRGTRENRGLGGIDTCWNQSLRKGASVQQAIIKSIGKGQAKAFTQIMRLPAFPSYNGKRLISKTGLTLPEIVISPEDKTAPLIGPVQENRKPGLSDGLGLTPDVALRSSSGDALSLFEDWPIISLDPHQNRLRLPLNESLRMNLATTRALHGGNCPHGCP